MPNISFIAVDMIWLFGASCQWVNTPCLAGIHYLYWNSWCVARSWWDPSLGSPCTLWFWLVQLSHWYLFYGLILYCALLQCIFQVHRNKKHTSLSLSLTLTHTRTRAHTHTQGLSNIQ